MVSLREDRGRARFTGPVGSCSVLRYSSTWLPLVLCLYHPLLGPIHSWLQSVLWSKTRWRPLRAPFCVIPSLSLTLTQYCSGQKNYINPCHGFVRLKQSVGTDLDLMDSENGETVIQSHGQDCSRQHIQLSRGGLGSFSV